VVIGEIQYDYKSFSPAAKQLCGEFPLGGGYLDARLKSKEEGTQNFGDIYETLRLLLDPDLLKFLLGGLTLVAGAGIKKYVELWVEDRFNRTREHANPEPDALHKDLCRWLANILHHAALDAAKWKGAGSDVRGARLYISDLGAEGHSNRVFWVTFDTQLSSNRVVPIEEDPEIFFQKWFNAYYHLVVPFIAFMNTPDNICVQAFLGVNAKWVLNCNYSSVTITCEGDVDASPVIKSRFREHLVSNPPFTVDSATGLLHWRLCKELINSGSTTPILSLEDVHQVVHRCERCMPKMKASTA
jgi:hypothetical protein